MTTPYPYCTCDEPMPNDAQTACMLCGKKFVQPDPPALGVSVSETLETTEKLG